MGSGTGYLLRLSEPYKGSGRSVNADSAFASVKSAVQLKLKHGLSFAGMVKTAHREFPKKYLEQQEVKERGDHVAAVTEQKGVKLLAVGWADKKRKLTVSTYGNTLPGTPHKKRRWSVENGFERAFTKEVKRPSIVEHYFDAASAIDVHNHFRQGIVSLETAVKTQRWDFRLFCTILGMVLVNAYLAYRHFEASNAKHQNVPSFLEEVATELLKNRDGTRLTRGQSALFTTKVSLAKKNIPENLISSHKPVPLVKTLYAREQKKQYAQRLSDRIRNDREKQKMLQNYRCKLRCRVCGEKASTFCEACSKDSPDSTRGLLVLCGPNSKRACFFRCSHESAA